MQRASLLRVRPIAACAWIMYVSLLSAMSERSLHTDVISFEVIDRVIAAGPYDADFVNITSQYVVPDWFTDGKFGIYTHWGVYSVTAFGTEWYPRWMYEQGSKANADFSQRFGELSVSNGYKDLIPRFTGSAFDATEWTRVFQAAGARYAGPVGEHHDGFSMYASALNPFNAVRMGPHRDVTAELHAAAAAAGLHFLVSSHRAWHSAFYNRGRAVPNSDVAACACEGNEAAMDADFCALYCPANADELEPSESFMSDWLLRTCELIRRHPSDVLFLDWWISVADEWQPYVARMAAFYYNTKAAIGETGVITTKFDSMPSGASVLDIARGQACAVQPWPWQTDTSISTQSWGFLENDTYYSPSAVIANLVDIVSKNGNMLMNVGPAPDGTIPAAAVSTLTQVGEWLRTGAGEAIFGSRPFHVFGEGPTLFGCGAFADDQPEFTPRDFRFTTKANRTVFAIAMGSGQQQQQQRLFIRSLGRASRIYNSGSVQQVVMLGHGPVRFEELEDGLVVKLPPATSTGRLTAGPRVLAVHGLRTVQWDGVMRQRNDGGFELPCTASDQLSAGAQLNTVPTCAGGSLTVVSGLTTSEARIRWSIRRNLPHDGTLGMGISALVSSPTLAATILLTIEPMNGDEAPISLYVPQTMPGEFVVIEAARRLAVSHGDSKLELRVPRGNTTTLQIAELSLVQNTIR